MEKHGALVWFVIALAAGCATDVDGDDPIAEGDGAGSGKADDLDEGAFPTSLAVEFLEESAALELDEPPPGWTESPDGESFHFERVYPISGEFREEVPSGLGTASILLDPAGLLSLRYVPAGAADEAMSTTVVPLSQGRLDLVAGDIVLELQARGDTAGDSWHFYGSVTLRSDPCDFLVCEPPGEGLGEDPPCPPECL